MELSFDSLRKIQLQERNFGVLANLEDNFYEQYNFFLLELRRKLQDSFSLENLKMYENTKSILSEIKERREQKILFKAFSDLKAKTVFTEGLTKEEKEFYFNLLNLLKEFENAIISEKPLKKEEKTEVKGEEKGKQTSETEKIEKTKNEIKIKLLVDLPEFLFADRKYGPYKASEIADIRKDIGEILIKKKAAELVQDEHTIVLN